MKGITNIIANALWNQGIIQKEDIDTCRYGLDVFFSSIVEVVSILVISLFVGNFIETFLFFTSFIPLRIYAGGYHANTKMRCYFVSLGVYGLFTYIMANISHSFYLPVNYISTLFSLAIVYCIAPVIHKNKSVSDIEKEHFRKFSICICLVETVFILLLTIVFSKSPFIASLALGQIAVTLSMIVAAIKEKMVVK